jgi:multicomponent Na+:H+ antiporter subunit E
MTKLKNSSRFWLTFVLLFGFWLLLSGRLDMLHLGFGLACSFLVALVSHDLLMKSSRGSLSRLRALIRLIPFLGWLVYQIILANIQVARIVINPKMPIRPGIVRFRSRLTGDVAQTTLANSITLTPGTMTLDIVGSDYYIHCLAIKDEEKILEDERGFERHVELLLGDNK